MGSGAGSPRCCSGSWRNQGLTRRSYHRRRRERACWTGVALTCSGLAWLERSAAVGGVLSAQTLLAPQLARTLGGRITSLEPRALCCARGSRSRCLAAALCRATNRCSSCSHGWSAPRQPGRGGSVVPSFRRRALPRSGADRTSGVERSRRVLSLIAVAATIAVAIVTTRVRPPRVASAASTAGTVRARPDASSGARFRPSVRSPLLPAPAVGSRTTDAGPSASLPDDRGVDDADYIVLRREDYHTLRSARPSGGPRRRAAPAALQDGREFGPWVIARVMRGLRDASFRGRAGQLQRHLLALPQ
jgi:hypothetical protein